MEGMSSSRRLVSVLATSALVLVACGGSEDAEPSPTSTTTTVAAADEPAVTEPAPTTTEPASAGAAAVETDPAPVETDPPPVETDPAPTTAPDDGADGSCLIGDWVITQDEMNAYYDTVTAGIDAGGSEVDIDIVGQTFLTFTESEYVYTADFDLTLAVVGTTGTGVATGTVSGTWEATDGRVVTVLGANDLSVIVTVGGQTVDGSDVADGFLTSSPINDAPYDCAGPTLGFQAGSTGEIRHDVTLTPA